MASPLSSYDGDDVASSNTEDACDVCTSDSAIGSELVEDDNSVPLSVASLSDDDDDDDDDDLCETRTSSRSSPTKSLPRSPSKPCSPDSLKQSTLEAPLDVVDPSCPAAPHSPAKRATSPADANDNVTNHDSSISSSATSLPCNSCFSQTPIASDSRDEDSSQGSVRRRRPPAFTPPPTPPLEERVPSSFSNGRTRAANGVEDVPLENVASVTSVAATTDYLADSCDEDDAAGGGATAQEPVSSAKKTATVEEDDGSRNASFNKWDPTSWPSWFERLFTNGAASCESSFDDDVIDLDGSW